MRTVVRRIAVPATVLAAAAITAVMATAVDASPASDAHTKAEHSNGKRSNGQVGRTPSAPADFNISATSCRSGHLPADPELKRGEIIVVTMHGFAAGTPVQVRVAYEAASTIQPHADAAGALRLVYRVPETLSTGSHLLTLSGLGPVSGSGPDEGNMSVTVPNTGLLHFRVSASRRGTPVCDLVPTRL